MGKDFARWAKVAEEVENRHIEEMPHVGAIYWANLGVNIGSTEDGKGARFTRPVLVIAKINTKRILIIPISSQKREGANYRPILVSGQIEYLLFDQMRTIDIRCIENYIDETDSVTLRRFKNDCIRILKYHFYNS